jgi:hypothetical protein
MKDGIKKVDEIRVGDLIQCTMGAWYGLTVEALIQGKEYKVLGLRGCMVLVQDETKQENEFPAKLYFDRDLY